MPAMALISACGPGDVVIEPADPCGRNEGVFEGSLVLRDDVYFDSEGKAFAEVGDGTIEKCREIRGDLVLAGKVTRLNDFDALETVGNIIIDGAELPSDEYFVGTSRSEICGTLGPFASLVTILGGILGQSSQGCTYKVGFEHLENISGDFSCGPNTEVGTSLRVVVGTFWCANPTPDLEYVGESLAAYPVLPKLQFAGRLEIQGRLGPIIDLSALEQVGPLQHGNLISSEPALLIEQNDDVESILVPRLKHVDGDFRVCGNIGSGDFGVSESVWEQTAQTTVAGAKVICANTVGAFSDPCPGDERCVEVFGEDNIRCCTEQPWSVCAEIFEEGAP